MTITFPFLSCFCFVLGFTSTASQGTIFLKGDSKFNATTDVESWANLSLDARNMRDEQDGNEKLKIYLNGGNAFQIMENGTRIPRTLASLSLDSESAMKDDPMYNFFRHAYFVLGKNLEREDAGTFDKEPVEHYANALVNDLFLLNITDIETEAALILNVWMWCVHELYNVLRACQRNNANEMNAALDITVALWVGANQPYGENEEGNMLYNLAEKISAKFDQDDVEARVNKELINLFNGLQLNINTREICNYVDFRDTVRKIFSLMTVPMIQILLHHIRSPDTDGKSDFIELYTLAIAPQIEVCNPIAYTAMLDMFVKGDFDENAQEKAIDLIRSIYPCLGISCEQIGTYEAYDTKCEDFDKSIPGVLAGYPATFNVDEYANIDKDIAQIAVMLQFGAKAAAKDYYMYGSNAHSNGTMLSLRFLATSVERNSATPQFDQFRNYFNSDNYGDNMVISILDGEDPFGNASNSLVVDVTLGYLVLMVTYMSSLAKFYQAVKLCYSGKPLTTNESVELWDQGVALFVGSLEGPENGGRNGGQLLFATSKLLCPFFDTCSATRDAEINQVLLKAFAFGSDSLNLEHCEEAEGQLEKVIAPGMAVPLIQGTLKATVEKENVTFGYAFSQAILPLINAVSQEDAEIIERMTEFQDTSGLVPSNVSAVFDAFRDAVNLMTTDCGDIGVYGDFGGFCSYNNDTASFSPGRAPVPAPISSSTGAPQGSPSSLAPTLLGFGRYIFNSSAASIADIALDVRDMQQTGNVTDANSIYLNGKYAFNGLTPVSLAQLSRNASTYMQQDPMFNIFRWALVDEDVFNSSESAFADIVVGKAFSAAENQALAAETAVVMNIWMEISHDLYESIRKCNKGDSQSAAASIDRAVALWLGTDQADGSFTTGYLMYHITQQAARNFGQSEGEASINTDLIDRFNQAKRATMDCENNRNAFLGLRELVNTILVGMTVPLLQNLLYYIDKEDDNYIELYALSVLPQAVACGEKNFLYLRDILVNENAFNPNTINNNFFKSMKRFQQCLRITCDDLMDLGRMRPPDSLRILVLMQCYDPADTDNRMLAGFVPNTTVADEMARLDLDIIQIGIFMEANAYDAAMDYYVHGYNSNGISLQELARSTARKFVTNQFNLFVNFFDSSNYSDDILLDALTQQGLFASASPSQLAAASVRTLQTLVSYMAILEHFYGAIRSCRAPNESNALELWETGVALYIGSMEGHARGGDSFGDGTLLYALAKDLCGFFGTCEGSGDAAINEFLIDAFSDGRNMLIVQNCDGTEVILNEEIVKSLPVPLIQGTLFESYILDETVDADAETSADSASGYIFAQSVLPLITNETSVDTINILLAFDQTGTQGQDNVDKVFDAFVFAIKDMNVDCEDISTYVNTSICSIVQSDDNVKVDDPYPESETSIDLGDGLYKTVTYVQDRANIALDVFDIEQALNSKLSSKAEDIYRTGTNSEIYNADGKSIGYRSFAKFSTEDTLDMSAESYFNLFTYALQDAPGQYQGNDVRLYADTIISQIFKSSKESTRSLATEGILVLNLWMALIHELEETLSNCKKKLIADEDGIHSIDEAVAYWIGDGQIFGNGDKGHLLYAFSERMGEKFGITENGQSRTNTYILRLFNQARLELSFPSACSENRSTYPRLRQIVTRIVSQMTIPLVQSLIYALQMNDRDRVKLYAQAFSPLVIACSPTLYAFLQDKLINLTYNVIDVATIVAAIRGSFDCLGITCDDVGVLKSESENTCADAPRLNSLAGFRPIHDVRSFSLLDLDILECSILFETTAFAACEDIYLYGKHALSSGDNGESVLSLSQLATTSDRTIVPKYEQFVQYFDSDSKYADTLIKRALDPDGFPGASNAQRKQIVVRTMQSSIIFMSILQMMYKAVADCNSSDASRVITASESWDRAAALMIGSVEGTVDGGNPDGQSFYALAKLRCLQFGTCGSSIGSEVNARLISLLYTGRGEVQAGSCSALQRAVDEMKPLLLVPLIQSTLHFAIENEKLPINSPDGALAEGFIYSVSVLPFVDEVSRESAMVIENNMRFLSNVKPVSDGASAVFNAFAPVYSGIGVACEMIGVINGMDPCNGANRAGGRKTKSGLIVGITLGVVVLLATGAFVYIKRPYRRSRKSGDDPNLIKNNNGELNHNDDLLTGNLNDASVMMSDEMYDKSVAEQAPIV